MLIKSLLQALKERDDCKTQEIAVLILRHEPPYPSSLRKLARAALTNSRSQKVDNLSEECVEAEELNYIKHVLSSGLFDKKYYEEQRDEVFSTEMEAAKDFCQSGWKNKLSPSKLFNTGFYLSCNSDIRESLINPLLHFIWQGRSEGRSPLPVSLDKESELQSSVDAQYVPWSRTHLESNPTGAKIFCFYLPQFHEIEENSKWWGKGFTEWTNVKKAMPIFPGHNQPLAPGELGYYSLDDPEVLTRQSKLASAYGISGFCFYFYWFNGKTLLEKPLQHLLRNPKVSTEFCLCWANENWTRRWDGLENEVLISQNHSADDDIDFISHVSSYFSDSRYLRLDGKPVLIVYRPSLLPCALKTSQRWREWCRNNRIGEIVLVNCHSFDFSDPREIGFDIALEFAPHNMQLGHVDPRSLDANPDFKGHIIEWRDLLARSGKYEQKEYPIIRCVNPGWDNTARRGEQATILINSSPRLYCRLAENALSDAIAPNNNSQPLLFVNAWNEWAESAVLEPTASLGYANLSSTRQACFNVASRNKLWRCSNSDTAALCIHSFYPEILDDMLRYVSLQGVAEKVFSRLIVTTTVDKLAETEKIAHESCFGADCIDIIAVENRGRDIRPFLQVLEYCAQLGIGIACKVHTKKSTHRVDGDKWRHDIITALLGKEATKSAPKLLCSAQSNGSCLGLIAPKNHLLPMGHYWGSNEINVLKLCSRMGLNVERVINSHFPAGSMYWLRVDALLPLLASVSIDEFEAETGQTDGTLAHAFERAIGPCVENTGYEMAEISSDGSVATGGVDLKSGNYFTYA